MIQVKLISKPIRYSGSLVGNAINEAHEKAGIVIKNELVRGLTTGKRSGRIYTIRGKNHQASAAGEMPAKLSGKLAASVDYKTRNKVLVIGEGAGYAAYLELGTSKMAARPHLRKVVDKNMVKVRQFVGLEIMEALK
jgi:HK97 gp10 family phage protein